MDHVSFLSLRKYVGALNLETPGEYHEQSVLYGKSKILPHETFMNASGSFQRDSVLCLSFEIFISSDLVIPFMFSGILKVCDVQNYRWGLSYQI